jgi:ankyrin repeat protein
MSSSKSAHGPSKDEIFHAIQNGNLDLLKTLVNQDNVNIKDRSGYTLLHVATNLEKSNIAKWLVSIGADLNIHCNSHNVLSLALNKANYDLFNYYLENKADCIGRNQLNLLHEATNKEQYDIVEKLIEKGADPNQFNSLQITPLTISVQHKNKRIILLLLESGACANLPDKKGNTAIHLACNMGDVEIVNCLLDNTECDLKLKNLVDETPLDLYIINCMRESKLPDSNLINKIIELGGLMSMPWNYTLNTSNHYIFIKLMSILCKYRLNDLFLNERPLFSDLIINGYWSNSLIVAIKAAIIEYKSGNEHQKEIFKEIEIILLSNELNLSESDLISTFYMFDEVDDYEMYKFIKNLYSKPFNLKSLARIRIRKLLSSLSVETIEKLKLNEEMKNFLIFESIQNSKFN